MIRDLITDKTYLDDIVCNSWEELVDIGAGLLVSQGSVEPAFIQSIKDTVKEFGPYMVVVDDLAFFHGRPEAGVRELSMSLVLLREPVYLEGKRILAAIVFAATDNKSHLEIMRELGGFLQDEEFLSLLRSHGAKSAIMNKIQEGAQTLRVRANSIWVAIRKSAAMWFSCMSHASCTRPLMIRLIQAAMFE
ncbi:MAG: PTS sugar transporter subunit IIA [Oscillospiraceae bacterium]|jgi:PTS system ascorbate-specific IIA component|nr:PTS sugar transporter subunit IIA [Oscillospiraceae bacterium]